MQTMCMIKDLDPEYIKSSHNNEKTTQKTDTEFEQIVLQRRYTNGQ